MTRIAHLIQDINEKIEDMEFHEILYRAREILGMKIYKTSEYTKINMGRLKRLEAGMFRSMPRREELEELSSFYGIPQKKLEQKAQEYITRFSRQKKVTGYVKN